MNLEWSPPWAPHVRGEHERWDSTDPEPIRYKIVCEGCEATWQGECATGRVREKISKFALAHLQCGRAAKSNG